MSKDYNDWLEHITYKERKIKEISTITQEFIDGKIPYYVNERIPNFVDLGRPQYLYRTIEDWYESEEFKHFTRFKDYDGVEFEDNEFWGKMMFVKWKSIEGREPRKKTFIAFIKGNFQTKNKEDEFCYYRKNK